MRDKLQSYVSLLFAGVQGAEDIREEILQNTLDRYDDLISQGKSPEAAYRLAITGIGDLSEILSDAPIASSFPSGRPGPSPEKKTSDSRIDTPLKALGRSAAIGLYILSPLPLFVLSEFGMETIGFCGLIAIVAVATVLIMLCQKTSVSEKSAVKEEKRESELSKGINGLIWAVGLGAYLILSFSTSAWHITWILFPIIGAVQGLIRAIMDLKEE